MAHLYLPGTSGNFASTPDHADFDIAGDIEIIARVGPGDWTSTLVFVAKYESSSLDRDWLFLTTSGGLPRLIWYETGPTQKVATGDTLFSFSDGDTGWVRVTMDVDNGASDADIKFWESTDTTNDPDSVSWSQVGSTVNPGATTDIRLSSADIEVGSWATGTQTPLDARVYRATVKDGLGGSTVFDADFTNLTTSEIDGGSFTEETGKTVTINGSSTEYFWDTQNMLTLGVG